MDWSMLEGEGESSSPPCQPQQPLQGLGAVDTGRIRDEIYARLLEIKNEEATRNPNFRYELDAHLDRFPLSYAVDVMGIDRVEDIVVHKGLLAKAKDSNKRPSFNARLLKVEDLNLAERKDAELIGNGKFAVDNASKRSGTSFGPVHKITFSTRDRPKLLSQLSTLLSDVGLNIQEAHVFSTNDGFSLDVFSVDGWFTESTDELSRELQLAIDKTEDAYYISISDNPLLSYVELQKPGRDLSIQTYLADWEIDMQLVERGEKIGSGSCGDLYHGLYQGQEVAIKILKFEHLTHSVEVEFTEEVNILRNVEHGNVVCFIGACTKPQLCLVTEYMSCGSVYDFLHKHDKIMTFSHVFQNMVKPQLDASSSIAVGRRKAVRATTQRQDLGRRRVFSFLVASVAAVTLPDTSDSKNTILQEYLKKTEKNKAKNDKERLDDYYKRNYKDYFGFVDSTKSDEQLSDTEKRIRDWLRANK